QTGRHAINYSPFVDFTYRFLNENRFIRKNLRLRYNGQTRQPSITQLDPSENNTNPLNIRSGNPDLLPSFNNSISLEFNSSNRESQRSLTASISHTFVQNQIINYTSYDTETGVQHTRPINENGTWSSSGNVFMAIPLDNKKRFKFSSRSTASYDNNIQYSKAGATQSSARYVSNTLNLRQELNLSYSNDWYYGQLRGNIRYQDTRYSLDGLQGIKSYNYSVAYNTQLTLPWSLTVSSDITYTGNSGLSAGYNKNEVMWNAEIGKQFLKQNRGSLRLQLTDILQQRLNIRRSVGGDYIQDSEFTALSSYFIVSFAYRFSNIGGGRRNRSERFGAGENAEPGGETPMYDRGGFGGGERPSGGFGGGRDRNF
ncbi:MAG: outer membrane beta-barrel family protein, partial [Prevotella sp.]|nr:outer membrane beta-barrel family protein [Prevotella sp.]